VDDTGLTGSKPQLSRVLGLTQVTASGVGVIIGAGIYVLIGEATREAGAGVWMAFVVAAGISALTGLGYAELSSMFPRASAEFEYTRQAFPQGVAFVVGWVMVAGLAVGAAAVALGFARYFRVYFDVDDRTVALGLLLIVAAVAFGGIKNTARVTLAFCAVQIGGLLVVSLVGIDHVGDVDLTETTGTFGVLGAAALVFFAFIGFDEVITLAEETKDPTRIIPRALLASLGISAALYALVGVVAVSVLGAERVASSEAPLADVVGHVWPGRGAESIAVIAMVSTFNTTLLVVTASSRLLYGMASSQALPGVFARLNRRQAPFAAIAVALSAAFAFVLVDDVRLIAGITDTSVYVVFLAVNASVILLRLRQPARHRPFRVRGALFGVPIVATAGFIATLVMMLQLEMASLIVGAGIVVSGAFGYVLLGRDAGPRGR